MLTYEEFRDEFLSVEEYNGDKVIRRKVGNAVGGFNPDYYIYISLTSFYSVQDEYEDYCRAYRKFNNFFSMSLTDEA